MNQYFVDKDLNKKRCDERKDLYKERREENFAKQPSMFDDGGDEPAEAKYDILGKKTDTFGHQQEFTGPYRFEVLFGQDSRLQL